MTTTRDKHSGGDLAIIHWHSQTIYAAWLYAQRNPIAIKEVLASHGAFEFPTYHSGMTPASILPDNLGTETGMGYAWIRDNCFVAYSLLLNGNHNKAAGIVRAVLSIFQKHEQQLDDIISGVTDQNDVMQRPPVRVVGDTLDTTGRWPNAQNDSIGYALWIVAQLNYAGHLSLNEDNLRVLGKLVQYLEAIEYWHDEDNGHWEEDRKIHAASIGAVVAGLEAIHQANTTVLNQHKIHDLTEKGRDSLDSLLTNCPLDASLLFLVEPLRVVSEQQARTIVDMVEQNLCREYGIIRYPNDSYWNANYRDHFDLGDRTADFSERLEERDQFSIPGHEAQWTLFDPMLSLYYHRKHLSTQDTTDQQKSFYYLERSLASFEEHDGKWQIPEAYFFEHDQWVANDHVPLLWSQANLLSVLSIIPDSKEYTNSYGRRIY